MIGQQQPLTVAVDFADIRGDALGKPLLADGRFDYSEADWSFEDLRIQHGESTALVNGNPYTDAGADFDVVVGRVRERSDEARFQSESELGVVDEEIGRIAVGGVEIESQQRSADPDRHLRGDEDDREQDPNHPFNQPQFRNASVLVAGRNFGCGSSREHAPQSLMRWGIKAVIAESFAEIFFGNCGALGIAAVRASRNDLNTLAAAIESDPKAELTVDLQTLSVTVGDITRPVEMPDSVRDSLVSGEWDFLSQLLSAREQVAAHAATIPYLNGFNA